DLVLHDHRSLSRLDGPVLYLGNHESYLESVIFSAVMPTVTGRPMRALAKVEHQTRWLGRLHALLTGYPGLRLDPQILWFDQAEPATLRPTLDALPGGTSLLVHVEGTRQTVPAQRVEKVASIWVDYAIARGMHIVPVAFRGGVNGAKTDVPVAPQAHHVGAPIAPATLAAMPLAARRQAIADAINALPGADTPDVSATCISHPGAAIVEAVMSRRGAEIERADAAWRARFLGVREG
ncbi:MAG: hypothetical protein FJ090_09900, partial [Deltaproteobacteria bacterium]|nr:hypothetical protein [Deltaproteobacteria bacterium]